MSGRKSKYKLEITDKKIWSVALYIRLSQEDIDNDELKKESNSVTSQKTILNEFVEEYDDLTVFDTYIDDGFSGTDFNRPAFQRLLNDMKNGKINCIIVKDLSRLGRNYIEVGNYIEQVFPVFNVRFIAINDFVDSFTNPSSTNNILVPFKNLINDEYARDTSIKIRSSLDGKKKKGEYVGAFPAYGYLKDENNKHKLIIDESVSYIVKNIFNWFVYEGMGKIAICHRLNELGILNPTGHKKIELKQNYNNVRSNNYYFWTPSTIRNILKNEIYVGNTVQGKKRTKSYKIHKTEKVPEEQWVKVENTHEAIIDKDTFAKAQILNNLDIKVSQNTSKLSIWAGILKCADCKMAMNKKNSINKCGKNYEYYICSTYRKKSNKLCSKHTIREDKLNKAVLEAINENIKNIDKINIINTLKTNKCDNIINNIEKNIINRKNEIDKKMQIKKELYEDWKNEYITKEEYLEYREKFDKDIENLNKNIEALEKEKQKYESDKNKNNKWIKNFVEQKEFQNLSREIIMELIDCIYIHENQKITVKFKFECEENK